jgi:hypothetical protein
MFGFTIIKKEELDELRSEYIEKHKVMQKVMQVHRWFSGWEDLDIIWDYILKEKNFGIDRVREEYAKARGTGVYGESLK